jgi:catechol 2,3-dioxygenase-like lactoylglutathione lyase family enzyme
VSTAVPGHINLVVRDIGRSVAFYELLGWRAEVAGPHASFPFDGFEVEMDEVEFARQWNRGTPPVSGGSSVFCVYVAGRSEVDDLVERVTAAGHPLVQTAYDAFWGARFAVVADPDGYQIGIMSPIEADRKYWPPREAPASLDRS